MPVGLSAKKRALGANWTFKNLWCPLYIRLLFNAMHRLVVQAIRNSVWDCKLMGFRLKLNNQIVSLKTSKVNLKNDPIYSNKTPSNSSETVWHCKHLMQRHGHQYSASLNPVKKKKYYSNNLLQWLKIITICLKKSENFSSPFKC